MAADGELDDTTTINVSSLSALTTALKNASGPTTILLAPGDYGYLNLKNLDFGSEVTIKSADPSDPATFSSAAFTNVTNLTIDGVRFDYDASSGDDVDLANVIVRDCNGITIKNSTFDGDFAKGVSSAANGYATGTGLYVVDSKNLSIQSNEFVNWKTGAQFERVENVAVLWNEIHGMRSDGLDFGDADNVVIEGNYIHDFVAATKTSDHPDMIQFWTTHSSTPSTNITIRGNFLDQGDGSATQSIFIWNEKVSDQGAGVGMFYRNILIEDNVIKNSDYHGITVAEAVGVVISNNTLLQNSGATSSTYIPGINVEDRALDVLVSYNIVPRLNIDSDDATIEANLIVQRSDPTGENYYAVLFVNALGDTSATLDDLRALAGSIIESLSVGSLFTRLDLTEPWIEAGAYSGVAIGGSKFADVIDADHTVAGQYLPTQHDDVIRGRAGGDTIAGLGGDDVILAGKGKDRMVGGAGDDTLVSGKGKDMMTGGSGADIFSFKQNLVKSKADTVTDLNTAEDFVQVKLNALKIGGDHGLIGDGFFIHAGEALTENTRIIYDQNSGTLLFDPDGSGSRAAVKFATISSGLDLSLEHFLFA